MNDFYLLKANNLPGDIDIHSDILSVVPSALSRKRALKTGREKQSEMVDKRGPESCILCRPNIKPAGTSEVKTVIPNRCADFINDFPYLPGDQRVIFLWNENEEIRKSCIHRYKLADLTKIDLFWLLKGCIVRGKQYKINPESNETTELHEDLLRKAPDQMRMVVGFNFGKLAGQSIPHFHAQYGWEVVLNPTALSDNTLQLYFEELRSADLIIHETDEVRVVAPWTPMGQYALDVYFVGKYDICEMSDLDIKLFSVIGESVVQKYHSLGINNMNIVFTNSPDNKKIQPLVAHFVPRVNMTALYEIKGVNVVDTPPSKIAEEFKRYTETDDKNDDKNDDKKEIDWVQLIKKANSFDPDKEYEETFALTTKKTDPNKSQKQTTESENKPAE